MALVHEPGLVLLLGLVLAIGALIGSVGIGGLLLTPTLVAFGGLGIREAIATAMASFIATGLVAFAMFRRSNATIERQTLLLVAAMPGALAGAVALWWVPEWIAVLLLSLFMAVTGLRLLFTALRARHSPGPSSHASDVAGLGAVAGFFSALTGTGGPMVLVPLLSWRGFPVPAAIALGQLIQLPIAAVATLGNYAAGEVNFALAAIIGVLLAPGVVAGRWMAARLPLVVMTRGVAGLLIVAAGYLAWSHLPSM